MPVVIPALLTSTLTATAASSSTITAEPPTVVAPVKPAPEPEAWKPTFQPGILFQFWGIATHTDATTSTMRLRRAELALRGEILKDRIAYAIMIDPAKVLEFKDTVLSPGEVTAKQPVSAVSAFQDAFLTFKFELADISFGQFKIPVSWEGYNPSGKLLFPERAPVAREFGDRRDIGVRVAKTFERFGYSAGLFNGATLNNLDSNNAKDAALRLEAYPIDGLVLAGVIYGSIAERGEKSTKDRLEVDVRFESGPFLIQAEAIRARDVGSTDVSAHGFYAAVAYTLFDVVRPAVRAGYLDPDADRNLDPAVSSGRDELWHLDLGATWFILGHNAKLQASYTRTFFGDKKAQDDAILAVQLWY
jgi:hypothetical protein